MTANPRGTQTEKIFRKPHIFMIVENSFPHDARVRKEAKTLEEFYNVTVVALKRQGERFHEMIGGIEVFRFPRLDFSGLQFKHQYITGIVGKLGYILQYFYITLAGLFTFLGTYLKRRYSVIHVHNPPDTLFLVGLIGRLFGAKFVFDHHDLCPELYQVKFSRKRDLVHGSLMWCERFSCLLANIIISTNESYRKIEIDRHRVQPDKVHIVRNDPVLSEWTACERSTCDRISGEDGRKIIAFVGSINPQDGLDLLLSALYRLVNDIGETGFICWIIGDGDAIEAMKQMAREYNIVQYVDFKGLVVDRAELLEYLSQADICVEPAPDNELNKHSTFIKVMEYMAAGKPLVAFDLPETRFSAEGAGLLIRPNDVDAFAGAIKQLIDSRSLRESLGSVGKERTNRELNWNASASALLGAYRMLLGQSNKTH